MVEESFRGLERTLCSRRHSHKCGAKFKTEFSQRHLRILEESVMWALLAPGVRLHVTPP